MGAVCGREDSGWRGGGGGRGGAEEREVGRELMSGRFVPSRFILSLS